MKCNLGGVVASVLLAVAWTGAARAQIVVRAGEGGVNYQAVNPMGPSMQYLQGPQMEKELDIVPEQRDAITSLRREVMEKTRGLWTSTAEGDPQSRSERYQQAAKALADETEKKIQQLLLPHQLRRLSQIVLQQKLRQAGYGSAKALLADEFTDELGISEAQKEKLRETEQELAREIREKTQEFQKKLQAESREKLLSVLTRAQRRRLEGMLGEPFERQPPQPYTQPLMLPAGGAAGRIAIPLGEIERVREQVETLKRPMP